MNNFLEIVVKCSHFKADNTNKKMGTASYGNRELGNAFEFGNAR